MIAMARLREGRDGPLMNTRFFLALEMSGFNGGVLTPAVPIGRSERIILLGTPAIRLSIVAELVNRRWNGTPDRRRRAILFAVVPGRGSVEPNRLEAYRSGRWPRRPKVFRRGGSSTWPHSGSWGLLPSGGLGLVVIIVLVLLLGRI